MKKVIYLFGILAFGSIILTGCAMSINSTKHNDQPEVACPFDLSRTDYTVIKQVYTEFQATYVFGIGGWNTNSRNAVEELIKIANIENQEQVVNITTKTRINVILCGIAVKRVTSATGTLIQFTNSDTIKVHDIDNSNKIVMEQDYSEKSLTIDECYIAYLIKSNHLDKRFIDQLNKKMNMQKINAELKLYSLQELQKVSKAHKKELEKYYK